MADSLVRIAEPLLGDTTARLDAEAITRAAVVYLRERIRIAGLADGAYADVNGDDELLVHDQHVIAAVQAVTAAIAAGIVVSGSVALDAATLAALETVNAVVSGTVALDAPTLAALETITVANPGLTDAELRASAVPVDVSDAFLLDATFTARVPDEAGTWKYYPGAAGTVNVLAGEKVIGIAGIATAAGATVEIDGGGALPIPENIGVDFAPRGNLVGPSVIVFTGTVSFLVEVLA